MARFVRQSSSVLVLGLVCACGGVATDPGDTGGALTLADAERNAREGTDPLTMLIVFDTSGSMGTDWNGRTRWQAAYDSVTDAVELYQNNLTVGAVVFPSDGNCAVNPVESEAQLDFQPGAAFLSSWQARLTGPNGSTPLAAAMNQADLAIARAESMGLLENRFRVLLFSDGEPSCADDLAAITRYPGLWQEKGIETYVVALPGSEVAATLLDDIANAGATGPEFGGGSAIVVDPVAQEIYEQGVEEQGASRVVVEDEEDVDDITRAALR